MPLLLTLSKLLVIIAVLEVGEARTIAYFGLKMTNFVSQYCS